MTVILVVDDDSGVRESLLRLLRAHGYETSSVGESTRVVDVALATTPDIILMDLQMTGMSGIEAARTVRSHPQLKQVYIVAISATLPDWDNSLGLFDGVLAKPCTSERLLDTLRQLQPR